MFIDYKLTSETTIVDLQRLFSELIDETYVYHKRICGSVGFKGNVFGCGMECTVDQDDRVESLTNEEAEVFLLLFKHEGRIPDSGNMLYTADSILSIITT
jgi:hypothetical protein